MALRAPSVPPPPRFPRNTPARFCESIYPSSSGPCRLSPPLGRPAAPFHPQAPQERVPLTQPRYANVSPAINFRLDKGRMRQFCPVPAHPLPLPHEIMTAVIRRAFRTPPRVAWRGGCREPRNNASRVLAPALLMLPASCAPLTGSAGSTRRRRPPRFLFRVVLPHSHSGRGWGRIEGGGGSEM